MDYELLLGFFILGLMFLAVMTPIVLLARKLKRRAAPRASTADSTLYASSYDYDPHLLNRSSQDRDDRDSRDDVGGDSGSDAGGGD